MAVAHVWIARPDAVRPIVLSPGERARMDRFQFERDRALYAAAHSLLRRALSTQDRAVDPADWTFTANAFGRPELDGAGDDLRFNLSHTGGLVACVVVRAVQCGIDIEVTRRRSRDELARRVLDPVEQRAVADRPELFLHYWTLKEAYVKARGMGLSLPLEQCVFDLSTTASGGPSLVRAPDDDVHGWRFLQFAPTPRHVLALALRSEAPCPITVTTIGC